MEEQNNGQEQVQEQINKVNINGQEYDPSEAQSLIELGTRTREYEKGANTSLDKIYPEFTKSTQRTKQLETELTQARSQLEKFSAKQDAGTETQTDVKQAREAAKKLGIILDEDLEKSGYIKKDDLEKFLEERLSARDAEKEAVNKILSTADKLEKEINGSDGRPKFNKRVVLAYANQYGITDLQKAYDEMHEDSLKGWKDKQITAQRQPSLKTLTASQGNKQPGEVKVNKDNVKSLLNEALYGSKE